MEIKKLFEEHDLSGSIIKSMRHSEENSTLIFCIEFPTRNVEKRKPTYVEPLSVKLNFRGVTDYDPLSFSFRFLNVIEWNYDGEFIYIKALNQEMKQYIEFSFEAESVDIEDISSIIDYLDPKQLFVNLNLNGFDFHLHIDGYHKETFSNTSDSSADWCEVSFSLNNPGLLSYSLKNQELLTTVEVEEMRTFVNSVLGREYVNPTLLTFTEKDLKFNYTPKYDDEDLHLEEQTSLIVSFWYNGQLTNNCVSLALSDSNLVALKVYLDIITGVYNYDEYKEIIHELILNEAFSRYDRENPLLDIIPLE